jgi:inner membrane protein involved in colicin E2 resistance
VLSGKPMGVVTPTHIQPGELAAALSYSAPISLLLFFVVLLALGALRGLDIHPINYFAIAAAFFAFQLLFAYSVDHLPLWLAFALSSAASLILVTSYLRLVVDTRFALRESAAAQLVYQVGFALAHFWEGHTGLTVAVLATATLFLVMQLTGRIKWGKVLSRSPAVAT